MRLIPITVHTRPTYKSNWKNIQKNWSKIQNFLNFKIPKYKPKTLIIEIWFNLDNMFYDPGISRIVKILIYWSNFVQNFSTSTRVYTVLENKLLHYEVFTSKNFQFSLRKTSSFRSFFELWISKLIFMASKLRTSKFSNF